MSTMATVISSVVAATLRKTLEFICLVCYNSSKESVSLCFRFGYGAWDLS